MKVIKQDGTEEPFTLKKVYQTVYSACINSHLSKAYSKKIADKVTKDIKKFVKGKNTIKSQKLFQEIAKTLKKNDYDAAFLYATHRDVS